MDFGLSPLLISLAKIRIVDPDVVIGHNLFGFDLDVLVHRMRDLNVGEWARLGRLRRSVWPKLQSSGDVQFALRAILSGRLGCDTFLAAKDTVREKSYALSHLAPSQLSIARKDVDVEKIPDMFASTEELLYLAKHTENDAYLAFLLTFKLGVLPLTRQLTCLAGNLWSRTLIGSRADRNEFLLLHEFHRRKYICPDKSYSYGKKADEEVPGRGDEEDDDEAQAPAKGKGRRKPAYSGGLVLEPKKGFYDKFILLLDFNSLYPSIIQEFNICFTTISRTATLAPAQVCSSR